MLRDVSAVRRGGLEARWAEALNGVGRPVEGEARARSALELFAGAALDTTRDTRPANARLFLAEALLAQGRWREAIAPYEQAAEIWNKSNDNPELLGWAYWGLAKCLCNDPERRSQARERAEGAISELTLIDPEMVGHINTWMASALSDQTRGHEKCRSSI